MKKKPLQATRTTPPVVEYVAVGRTAAWVVGGVVGGEPWRATVVGGEDGVVTLGWAVSGRGGGVTGFGLGATAPLGGVVGVELAALRVVVVVVWASGEPDCNSLTTSRCSTTGAGRS